MEINFDQRKKIAFPRFHHYDYATRYIAEQALGLCYIQLPPDTKVTVELGSKYSSDYACAPFKHTLGSLIEALETGADIVVETGGLCRLDYYGELQREILKELGYHFELKEEIKNGYQKAKSEMNRLEIRIPERPIRIGVVGEYFTVMDAHANQHLQEKLSSLGASVYRYTSGTNCHFRAKETALRPKIREYVNLIWDQPLLGR